MSASSSFKQLKAQRAQRVTLVQSSDRHLQASGNTADIDQNSFRFEMLETPDASVVGTSQTVSAATAVPVKETVFLSELSRAGLEVRESAQRGRGLYATASIRAGSTILRVKPVTSVLSTSSLSTHCSSCFKPAPKLLRCAACRGLYYCSSTCQRADWPTHKRECAAFKRLRSMWAAAYPDRAKRGEDGWMMNEAVRAMGRMCWARKAERVNGKDPDWWAGVAGMESHVKTLPESKVMKLGNQVQHLRHYLSAAEPSDTPDVLHPADMEEYGFSSGSELLDLCSAFGVNSFTLSMPDLSPIGVSTSPLVALANHACDPNAVVVFPSGAEMHVVAISDLAPGDEVLTSYIDVSMPFAERQKDLLERYDFTCSCGLCAESKDSTFVDPRSCVIDPKCGKPARMPERGSEVACECEEKVVIPLPQLKDLIARGRSIIAQDEQGTLDPDVGRRTLSTLVPALSNLVPPSTYPLLALLRLQSLLHPPTSLQDLQITIEALDRSLAGARAVFPTNHPNIAIILAERGKVLALDPDELSGSAVATNEPTMLSSERAVEKRRQLVKAIGALREAAEALDKGFGRGGGEVGKDIRALLETCEQEMAMLSR